MSFSILVLGVAVAVAAPTHSGPLAIDPCRAELWAVNEDAGTVTVVSLATLAVGAEIAVGLEPVAVAVAYDGGRAWVADAEGNRVVAIDAATRAVLDVDIRCHGPRGIAASSVDDRMVVVCADDDSVLLVDGVTVRATIPVADDPRAVAVAGDGASAYVTHFRNRARDARVSILDLASARVVTEIELPPDAHGHANLLGAIAIAPAGGQAWLGGVAANTAPDPLPAASRLGALALLVDLESRREVTARRRFVSTADSVSGIALSQDGRWLFLVHQGSSALTVFDLQVAGEPQLMARIPVGDVPRGIVVEGDRAFVLSWLDRSLHVIDLSEPRSPRLEASLRLSGREPLTAAVLNGKRMFYRASAPVHSARGNIACASCHPDGGNDGRTWDFSDRGEGRRNTIDLRGHGGMAQGPLHWSGNFDEVQDFEGDIVQHFGGSGLAADGLSPHAPLGQSNGGRSRELDDLATFVSTGTRTPRSPYRNRFDGLTAAAVRGRALFYRVDTGCAGCHVPPAFTSSSVQDFRRIDVGTLTAASGGRLGEPLSGLDVPTLKGLWDTGPYLHAGQATTLGEVLTRFNPDDRHGVTSSFGAAEIDDLVAFLLQLDDSADVLPIRH